MKFIAISFVSNICHSLFPFLSLSSPFVSPSLSLSAVFSSKPEAKEKYGKEKEGNEL